MTVLTNFEANPINSLGGVHSNTRRKSEKDHKMAAESENEKIKISDFRWGLEHGSKRLFCRSWDLIRGYRFSYIMVKRGAGADF